MRKKQPKNFLLCNELIIKSMQKRRQLAYSAISKICNTEGKLKVIK